MESHRILRLPMVIDRTGLGRSSIYSRVAEGNFPAPVSLGGGKAGKSGKAVGWIETEVQEWIQRQIDARTQKNGQQPRSGAKQS